MFTSIVLYIELYKCAHQSFGSQNHVEFLSLPLRWIFVVVFLCFRSGHGKFGELARNGGWDPEEVGWISEGRKWLEHRKKDSKVTIHCLFVLTPTLCTLTTDVHDYLPRRALRSGDGATLETSRTKTVTASQRQPFGMTFLSNWDSLPISMDLKLDLKLIFLLRVNHSHLAFWIFLDF